MHRSLLLLSLFLLYGCQAPPEAPRAIEPTETRDTPPPSAHVPGTTPTPHDVIVLTIDTLRFDHVSSQYAKSPAKTPHIDALAQQGLSFTQTYAPISVTGPSFITLFTGLFPRTHGALMNVFRGGNGLDASFDTMAERLKTAGFSTGAFVSGFTLRPKLGLDQGFDVYDHSGKAARRPGQDTVKAAKKWLGALEKDERAFLWFHTYDAHGPWDQVTTPKAHGKWDRGTRKVTKQMPRHQVIDEISDPAFYEQRYARSVELADAQVGTLIETLRTTGRYDNALIVLTADHGESFTERELWFGHGTSPLEEQLHVPLIVKLPAAVGAGRRSARLTSLADVVPSVNAWLGLAPQTPLDGRSFAKADDPGHSRLLGESSHCRRHRAVQCTPRGSRGKEFATRTTQTTVHRVQRKRGAEWIRYDRTTDAQELSPQTVTESDEGRRLLEEEVVWRKAQKFRGLVELETEALQPNSADAESTQPTEAPSDLEADALRALGYLD